MTATPLEFGHGPLADIDLTSPSTHAERDLAAVWQLLREHSPLAWHPVGPAHTAVAASTHSAAGPARAPGTNGPATTATGPAGTHSTHGVNSVAGANGTTGPARAAGANAPIASTTPAGFWVVTRHADALAVYRDPEGFTSTRGNVLATLLAGGDPAGGQMLVVSDGPRNLEIRRRLLRAFTPAALAGLGEQIAVSARALVQAAVDRGTCEFSADVAEHIPLTAICDLMQIPGPDRRTLLGHARATLAADTATATELDARVARNEILLYFARHARKRKDTPGDDVVGLLLQLTREPLALSQQELLLNCYSLLLGGDETSRLSLIGTVHALATFPGEWRRLQRREVTVDTAVEELLRWTTPTLHAGRTAAQARTLHGHSITPGQIVTAWNCAADFDPAEFTDPDRLDLGRKPNRHLAFGHGHHFCLGAQLARIELAALLEALLATTDSIELAAPPRRLYSNFLAGFSSLPVRLTPAR